MHEEDLQQLRWGSMASSHQALVAPEAHYAGGAHHAGALHAGGKHGDAEPLHQAHVAPEAHHAVHHAPVDHRAVHHAAPVVCIPLTILVTAC